uniref:DH domain-containing protein n=1 Tax=Arcella intermedia TaxID=1963864 RepID=A0A6B2KZM0_9EUKA
MLSPRSEEREKVERDARQRKMTVMEIVETEKDYVNDLETLVRMSNEIQQKKLLPPEIMAQVFSNVVVLQGVNANITAQISTEMTKVEALPNGKEENIDKLPIGKIFVGLVPFFKMYLVYCDNHDNALIVLAKQKKKNKQLENYINQQAETPQCKGLYLKDYLIKPIQRLCKYPLLFQNLLKLTPTSHDDYESLKTCVDKINDIVRDINQIRDKNVNFLSLFQIEERLVDYDNTLLAVQRKFIREGNFLIAEDKSSKVPNIKKSDAQERVILLFNDRIMICKKVHSLTSKTNNIKFVSEIETTVARVTDTFKTYPDYDVSFMLESHSDAGKVKMIFAESSKEKNNWFKLIQDTVNAAKSEKYKNNATTEDMVVSLEDVTDLQTFGEKEIRSLVPKLLSPGGIEIKKRKHKNKIYKNAFTGKELIDWLLSKGAKKELAPLMAQKFLELGYAKNAADGEDKQIKEEGIYQFDAISMDQSSEERKRTASGVSIMKSPSIKNTEKKSTSFGKAFSSSKKPQNTEKKFLSQQRKDPKSQTEGTEDNQDDIRSAENSHSHPNLRDSRGLRDSQSSQGMNIVDSTQTSCGLLSDNEEKESASIPTATPQTEPTQAAPSEKTNPTND